MFTREASASHPNALSLRGVTCRDEAIQRWLRISNCLFPFYLGHNDFG